jgi:D-inositol-3-phosphate glycosyltransferase
MKQRIARAPHEAEGEYRIQGEYEVIRLANRLVAATPAEMAQLQWLYEANKKKITIIPPGVDVSHFYPIPKDEAKEFIGIPTNDRMMLFVGRIEPLKGVDTLIQAISLIRQKGALDRHCCLCVSIIGGEPNADPTMMTDEMSRLQQLCDQQGLGDLVAFLGHRGQDTLPYYYSAADVVVMPSHYESFGMVALEAMACGTPVIATQVGGLAFLVRDGITGFHIPVDCPEALGERLVTLLDDHDLHAQMSHQAADIAQNYAWEKIASNMHTLYRDVLLQKISV